MFRESDYDDALWVYDDLSEQIEKLKNLPMIIVKKLKNLRKKNLRHLIA